MLTDPVEALEARMASSADLNDASTVDWEFATGVYRLNAAKYFMLASFVMLIYDHIITLSHEIDRIWQRQWTGATWLFALNRYLTELQFIVILVSFHDPALTGKRCDKLLAFPGASTMVSIGIAEIILVLRTYALYQRSKVILIFLSALWCAQMIVMGIVQRKPTRLVLPEGLVGCIQAGSGRFAVAFWLAPLVMDTVIFALTIFKTVMYTRKNRNRVRLIEVMLRDGIMYFTGIFAANLLNCMLYWLAANNLKVIGASFSQIITVLLISRLQLNLRSKSICSPQMPTSQQHPASSLPVDTRFHEKRLHSNGTSATISALSFYFETTVSELGRDMITEGTEDVSGEEVPVTTGACSCGTPRCDCAPSAEPEIELEMGPIRPVSGGVPAPLDISPFSPEEAEWLDRIIQISPAKLDDTWGEEGVK